MIKFKGVALFVPELRAGMLAVIFCMMSAPSLSAPTVLKCITDTGQKAVDLIVDIERNVFSWGSQQYRITHIDDVFITGQMVTNEIGGEVWVLNRATGQYTRAAVGMYCSDQNCEPQKLALNAFIYRGVCLKPQL